MKKLIVFTLFTLFFLTANASENLHQSKQDTIFITELLVPQTLFEGDDLLFSTLTLQAGFSSYDVQPGGNGYGFAAEYTHYATRNFYGFSQYYYSFTSNTEEVGSTGNYEQGRIQGHMLTLGLGFDMLRTMGHRVYAGLGVGASYQSFRLDLLGNDRAWAREEASVDEWALAYLLNVGYSYTVDPRFEIGVNWAGYFFTPYWGNTVNLRLGYKF